MVHESCPSQRRLVGVRDGLSRRRRRNRRCTENRVVARPGDPGRGASAYLVAYSDRHTGRVHLDLVAIVVDDYDAAIAFFVDRLGFELVEDSPATTNDGRPKRWVVVRPPAAQTGILLARADGERQRSVIGQQHAGRIGFFLHVDDFDASHAQMLSNGVDFVTEPRDEPYGRVAVFLDLAGNRWDLLGPASQTDM